MLDKEEPNVLGRVACLLCYVSRQRSVTVEEAATAGHALAPPRGFWKVHISPKCHFNCRDPP